VIFVPFGVSLGATLGLLAVIGASAGRIPGWLVKTELAVVERKASYPFPIEA
jgi:hypothetical protein